eukprot:scaffold577_cov273-Chaetoceros_neogracile.AAC.2
MEGDEDVREGDSDGEKFGHGKNWDRYDRKASYTRYARMLQFAVLNYFDCTARKICKKGLNDDSTNMQFQGR